jgi:flagellar assembly protein FliH
MATSPLIPKEQQSAYQRWELGAFDQPATQKAPAKSAASSADLLKQMNAHAEAEGYNAGHREGLEAGRVQALAEAAPHIARLDQLLTALDEDLQRVDRELAHEVVQLGLAVARKLVGAALQTRPEIVQECVEEALRHVVQSSGPINVMVNPEDAAIVRAHLEVSSRSGAWVLREDSSIACGGCRVVTAAGEVDATLGARWERITAALGEPLGWMDGVTR